MFQLIKDIFRLPELRRRERRLLEACERARLQARLRSPNSEGYGQPWLDLFDQLAPFEFQDRPAPLKPDYLLYHGTLSKDVLHNVRCALVKNPFVVEVKWRPPHSSMEAVFSDRSYVSHHENCMGQDYTRDETGVPYKFVNKVFTGNPRDPGFICLPDKDAWTRFQEAFPDLIENARPFRTVVDVYTDEARRYGVYEKGA